MFILLGNSVFINVGLNYLASHYKFSLKNHQHSHFKFSVVQVFSVMNFRILLASSYCPVPNLFPHFLGIRYRGIPLPGIRFVLFSYWCCNKLSQIYWLKHNLSHSSLDQKSKTRLKKVLWGWNQVAGSRTVFLLDSLGEKPFLASSSFKKPPASRGFVTAIPLTSAFAITSLLLEGNKFQIVY